MTYVIENVETGKLVARQGSQHSYTRDIRKVRVFKSREDAEAERCPENERILKITHSEGDD